MSRLHGLESIGGSFRIVFDEIGVGYRAQHDGRVDGKVPLSAPDGRSLQMYFHEPARPRGPFFSLNPRMYEGYRWSDDWEVADVERQTDYLLLLPRPGRERDALRSAMAFRSRQP